MTFKRLDYSKVKDINKNNIPTLNAIFNNYTSLLNIELKSLLTRNLIETKIKKIQKQEFSKAQSSIKEGSILSMFKSEKWDGLAILALESDLAFNLTDAMLGGSNKKIEIKPSYTKIEKGLIKIFIESVLNALSNSFQAIEDFKFEVERIESTKNLSGIVPESTQVLKIDIEFNMLIRKSSFNFHFLIPAKLFEPIKTELAKISFNSQVENDNKWQPYIKEEIKNAECRLDAILCRQTESLKNIQKLKKGDVLKLKTSQDSLMNIECNEKVLFKGELKHKNNLLNFLIHESNLKRKDN
jgi:flagellar motor switch protein FliM